MPSVCYHRLSDQVAVVRRRVAVLLIACAAVAARAMSFTAIGMGRRGTPVDPRDPRGAQGHRVRGAHSAFGCSHPPGAGPGVPGQAGRPPRSRSGRGRHPRRGRQECAARALPALRPLICWPTATYYDRARGRLETRVVTVLCLTILTTLAARGPHSAHYRQAHPRDHRLFAEPAALHPRRRPPRGRLNHPHGYGRCPSGPSTGR